MIYATPHGGSYPAADKDGIIALRNAAPQMLSILREIPQMVEVVKAAADFHEEAEAVLAGEISRDWADFYGPLFEKSERLRAAFGRINGTR